MTGTFKNILIIKPSSLGDVVLTLPALSALRRNFPNARISWLIRPEFAPLLENHPHLTDVIIFDRKFLGKAWHNPAAFGSLLSLIRQLRQKKFDLVIDFQGLFRSASLAWLSGCKNRFGMQNIRELAGLFYTHRVLQDSVNINLVDYYLKIIKAAGASDIGVQFILPQCQPAADSIRRLLTAHNVKSDKYAVFITGSAHPDKCWPSECFASLANKISLEFGWSIVATGSPPEKISIERLKNSANVPIANLAGLTSLHELIALLKSARMVVSNDTGPGHIAAALGTALVMIFGRSNPARVEPYKRPQCIAAIEPGSRGSNSNNTDPKYDIKAVTVDEVYKKILEQIKQELQKS